jgi:predicted RNA-binding Zn-ribbon protein involved in translation (DUF1610 family)
MSDTFDKCPVCDQIGFRIHVCTDGASMYICDNCGVCLWTEELETK